MIKRFRKHVTFISNDIWYVKLDKFPRWQRWFIKVMRIVLMGIKDFNEKQLILRSSALTYYSLLSIVPVLAMIFGIAQGFGLENYISEQVSKAFESQPEVRDNLLSYAHNMLQNTSGGWIAGLGFILLIWSVVQVLGNIENALNSIWYVKQPRNWVRKFTDYLAIMVVAPVFMLVTGTFNIFISTQIHELAQTLSVLGETVKELTIISIKFIPYISTWLLFSIVYMVMPNTRVKFSSALYAGVIAGTCFQVFQWAYIEFQIGVSSSNAIYGSFASIPLFITWLYFSWTIVLVGAEISYSIQNVKNFEGEKRTQRISHEQRMLYHLYVMSMIAKWFKGGKKGPTLVELSDQLDIPMALCRIIIDNCIKTGLVVEASDRQQKEALYTPGVDIKHLSIGHIIGKLHGLGEMQRIQASDTYHRIKTLYNQMEDDMGRSEAAGKNIAEL